MSFVFGNFVAIDFDGIVEFRYRSGAMNLKIVEFTTRAELMRLASFLRDQASKMPEFPV